MPQLFIYLSIFILIGCSEDQKDMPVDDEDLADPLPQSFYEAFEIWELTAQAENGFIELIDKSSMLVSFEALGANQVSSRIQTEFDEVFYVFHGSGKISAGSSEQMVSQGQTLIARGNVDTQVSTEDTIQVVVISMKKSGTLSEELSLFTKEQIESNKTSSTNTWNPFLKKSNVIFGLYALPQSQGGDNSLVHTWDEINIVTEGESRFTMNNESIDVTKGSIVFVRAGAGHFFSQLAADTDIMILWNQ